MRDPVNLFMAVILWAVVLHWLFSSIRGRHTARIDMMRKEEEKDAELDKPDRSFYIPSIPDNGLVIEREVRRGRVRTLYSCNGCGTSLRDATLCGICAAKKPVSF